MDSASFSSTLPPEMESIYSGVVADIQKQSERLEWSDCRLNFYRAIIKELAQKYIQFLTDDQKETVLRLQIILAKWDRVQLPQQPNLTHVAQAAIYHAQVAEGKMCRKGKKRPNHKKLAAAQLREKGFFQSFNQSVNQWQEGAEARCHLANAVDANIDKLHSIVIMLDNRFHHNLERFFREGPEGDSARKISSSVSKSAFIKTFPDKGDDNKSEGNASAIPVDDKGDDATSKELISTSCQEELLEWDEMDFSPQIDDKVLIEEEEDIKDSDANAETESQLTQKEFTIGDRVVVHWNYSRDIGTQTDYFDYKCFKDLDPSIKQFEESGYEYEGDNHSTSDESSDDEE